MPADPHGSPLRIQNRTGPAPEPDAVNSEPQGGPHGTPAQASGSRLQPARPIQAPRAFRETDLPSLLMTRGVDPPKQIRPHDTSGRSVVPASQMHLSATSPPPSQDSAPGHARSIARISQLPNLPGPASGQRSRSSSAENPACCACKRRDRLPQTCEAQHPQPRPPVARWPVEPIAHKARSHRPFHASGVWPE